MLVACGTPQASNGTIAGTFVMTEGGVELRAVPGQGQLVVRQDDRVVSSTQLASPHPFAVSVPAGMSQVGVHANGSPLRVECQSPPQVSVAAAQTVGVELRCLRFPDIGEETRRAATRWTGCPRPAGWGSAPVGGATRSAAMSPAACRRAGPTGSDPVPDAQVTNVAARRWNRQVSPSRWRVSR